MKPEIPEVDSDIPQNAVSLYGQAGAADDFPVLKAFQQYIDAEQSKARKRMVGLCMFFACLMTIIIAVFLFLLHEKSRSEQTANDQLIKILIADRDRQPIAANSAPVVVQPSQDSSAILALTAKLDEMQKKLAADQAKAEREAKEAAARAEKAAIEAAKPKGPTKEELEIQRLKEQLKARDAAEAKRAAEEKAKAKEKARLEKEARHQAEIEAYRRKHYPELYRKDADQKETVTKPKPKKVEKKSANDGDEDFELERVKAIRYFEDDEEDDPLPPPSRSTKKVTAPKETSKDELPISVDDKSSVSGRSWAIPED